MMKNYDNPCFGWSDCGDSWHNEIEELFDEFGYQVCDDDCPYSLQCENLDGEELVDFCVAKTGKEITVFIGECKSVTTEELVKSAHWRVKEHIEENAYEIADEYSDRYLEDLNKMLDEDVNCKELDGLISSWIENKIGKPSFYIVEDIKEINLLAYLRGDDDYTYTTPK